MTASRSARVVRAAASTTSYCRQISQEALEAAKSGDSVVSALLFLHALAEQTAEAVRLTEEITRLARGAR